MAKNPTETSWLTVRGVKLEAVERGQGQLILWLHGEEGLDPGAPVLDLLASHGRVLAPSHPGFGHSPDAATIDTVDDLAYLYLSGETPWSERHRRSSWRLRSWPASRARRRRHQDEPGRRAGGSAR